MIGAGPIGLLFSMLYKSAGAGMTIVIEPVDYRRRVAEACGVDTALDPTAGDSTEEIRSATRMEEPTLSLTPPVGSFSKHSMWPGQAAA